MKDDHVTFAQHFSELKKRTIYILLFFTCSFIGSYFFADQIYIFLLTPLSDYYISQGTQGAIIYTGLAEAFFTYLKISFISAVFFTVPFFTVHLFAFISPALKVAEKKMAIILLLAMPLLFSLGAFIAYYFVFPKCLPFFLSFENHTLEHLPIKLEARISEYLSLATQIILAFGIAFQLPIILTLLNKFGLVSIQWLKSQRRIAIVIIFTIAAIITPPDIWSQLVLAGIMILLYELSILLCIFFNTQKKEELNV